MCVNITLKMFRRITLLLKKDTILLQISTCFLYTSQISIFKATFFRKEQGKGVSDMSINIWYSVFHKLYVFLVAIHRIHKHHSTFLHLAITRRKCHLKMRLKASLLLENHLSAKCALRMHTYM